MDEWSAAGKRERGGGQRLMRRQLIRVAAADSQSHAAVDGGTFKLRLRITLPRSAERGSALEQSPFLATHAPPTLSAQLFPAHCVFHFSICAAAAPLRRRAAAAGRPAAIALHFRTPPRAAALQTACARETRRRDAATADAALL